MDKKVLELEKQISALESELQASMQREELLRNPVGGEGSWKQKLKRTVLWRVVADPNSKLGKIARSPRTVYRIIKNPNIIKEIMADKDKKGGGEEKPLLTPIKFFTSDDEAERVNLVVEKLDEPEMVKMAVKIANERRDGDHEIQKNGRHKEGAEGG